MPIDAEIQAYIDAYIDARLTKKRIPELEENVSPLSGEDCVALWNAADNKTRKETLNDLLEFFALGGDGSGAVGDSARTGIHIFPVSASDAGGNTVSLPQFAGKNFTLTIDGRDFLDGEFTVLNAGGFTVDIDGYELQAEARVKLTFGEPIATGSTSSSGGFLRGNVLVETSTTLTADDARKRIKVRGGATATTQTLPSVASLADNDFFVFETHITNSKQQKIATTGGQNIYFNGTSKTALYLGPGEVLILLRDSDGWYPLDNYTQIYREVGHPVARYAIEEGDILLKGQQVAKADYPRLYEKAQTFGGGFVPKATYDSDPEKYRGCYVEYSTTHFQLPNLMDMALRGLASESGVDANREHNAPGGYQGDSVGEHLHLFTDRYWAENSASLGSATNKETMSSGYNGSLGSGDTDSDNNTFLTYQAATLNAGGEETTGKNIGIYWVTKI